MQALKNAAISARIVAAMQANGGDIRKAYDAVMGEAFTRKATKNIYEIA